MKKTLAVIITIFCIFYFYPREKDKREEIKNKIVMKFIKEQKKKRNLSAYSTGFGEGKCKGKFDMIHVGFNTEKELTIESGRDLIVQLTNELLSEINSNAEFKDYIFPCPLNTDGIQVSVSVSDSITGTKCYQRGIQNEKVSYVYLYNNKINYCLDHSLQEPFEDLHDETFEEAVAILEKEVNNLNK